MKDGEVGGDSFIEETSWGGVTGTDSSLEFGAPRPVVVSSPQAVSLSYLGHWPKVYECPSLHGWVSFSRADGVGTSTLSHSRVLTRVPMCVDVSMRTPRDTGVPGLLCFPGSACSTNGTFVAAPCQASPSMLFFLQHLLTLWLCVHLGNSWTIPNLSIIIFDMVIWDLHSLMLPQPIEGSVDGIFLSNKGFGN
mgnify:CR=1 FL=1